MPWQLACERTGAKLVVVPITDEGEVPVDEFEKRLTARTKLAAVSHVSNALGTVNPVKAFIALAHARGVPVLVDGAQAAPHLPLDVEELGCDFYASRATRCTARRASARSTAPRPGWRSCPRIRAAAT